MIDPKLIREWEKELGADRKGPIVTFYDHAVPANQSAHDLQSKGKWKGERPRFKHAVFVEFRTRGDVTNSTSNQIAMDEDKEQFPREWEAYCERKKALENRAPSIKAIPGMDVVAFEELKALGLTDCQKLAEYEGDISPHNQLRVFASRIVEIANGEANQGMGTGRNPVQEIPGRPVHAMDGSNGIVTRPAPDGAGTVRSIDQIGKPVQAQGNRKRQVFDAPITFHYEMPA